MYLNLIRLILNLADYSSNTILVPKIQELPSLSLIKCVLNLNNMDYLKKISMANFNCQKSLIKEINQELFKRFYKPLYIPIIGLLCCFLIIVPKNNFTYKRNRKIVFFVTFLIIVLSEGSLRYSTLSYLNTIFYLTLPWVIFLFIYFIFNNRLKNV